VRNWVIDSNTHLYNLTASIKVVAGHHVLELDKSSPDSSLLVHVTATAGFASTTAASTTNKRHRTSTQKLARGIITLVLGFWIIMGITAKELFLAFLPRSVNTGIVQLLLWQ
jgi:hypothetical protein